jgi:hypothetical protein
MPILPEPNEFPLKQENDSTPVEQRHTTAIPTQDDGYQTDELPESDLAKAVQRLFKEYH